MAAINGEHWAEWEVDPSTRSSVHLWTKYVTATKTVAQDGITTVLVADKGTPAVNLAGNSSFEGTDISAYIAQGTNVAVTRQTYAGAAATKPAGANDPDGMLATLRMMKTGSNTAAASGNTAGDGWYFSSSAYNIHRDNVTNLVASVYVRQGSNTGGTVRMTVRNTSTGALVATGDTSATLSTTWQRLIVSYPKSAGQVAEPVKIHIETVTPWDASSATAGALFFDMFQVELKGGSGTSDYVDGHQPNTNGAAYEWLNGENSGSRKKMGLSRIRGVRITNESTTASHVLYVGIDDPKPTATTGIKIGAGETFETNHPIDAESVYVLEPDVAANSIRGVIWGVPNQ